MRISGLGLALVAGLLGAQPASAAGGKISLSKAAEQLPAGKVWLTIQDGLFCVTHETLKGDGVLRPQPNELLGPIFAREIAGVQGAATASHVNLFEQDADDTEAVYQVGALIHGADVKVCTLSYGHYDGGAKGGATLQVEWQIYSPAKRQVVATIETTGKAQAGRGTSRDEVIDILSQEAFADAARQLAASPNFQAVLNAPAPKDELQSNPSAQARIVADASGAAARPVAEAVGSVVLIKAGNAMGSGFLISNEGYVLTDAHVVDNNKTVKIRWSDGYETTGEVVRLHKKRDVALIKTDPHGRRPLPIRTSPMAVGETVWAIGTPLVEEFQNSVTRGVVSANRLLDGFAFIQSDVAVNHGNSGGPLLDDKGYVVGLTDLAFQPAYGVQSSQSYFTPIKDAIDFLSLDLKPPVQAAPPPAAKVTRTSGGGSRR